MTRMTIPTITLAAAVVSARPGPAGGAHTLPEPGIVLHGAITARGTPIDPTQTTVVVYAMADGDDPGFDTPLATYTVGANPLAYVDVNGNRMPDVGDEARYVLRLKMEFLPPGAVQSPGVVVRQDTVDLWVDPGTALPEPVGSFLVSGRGIVEEMDLVIGSVGCPGDADGDGTVDVQDLVLVTLGWGPCTGCAADLNDDGQVDVQDMVAVILNWGACP